MRQGKMLEFDRSDAAHEERMEEELNKYLQEGYSVKSMTFAYNLYLLVWLEREV